MGGGRWVVGGSGGVPPCRPLGAAPRGGVLPSAIPVQTRLRKGNVASEPGGTLKETPRPGRQTLCGVDAVSFTYNQIKLSYKSNVSFLCFPLGNREEART